MQKSEESEFFAAARRAVAPYFKRNPAIIWFDLLLTSAAGTTGFLACRAAANVLPAGSAWVWPMRAAGYMLAVVMYYRAAMFTHEIAHAKSGELKWFKIVWNTLVGIPFLMPAFLYTPHNDHHLVGAYGTGKDGEYLPMPSQGWWGVILYFAECLVLPLFFFVRFGVLAPLSWVYPPLMRWTHRHASTMVIDLSYQRQEVDSSEWWSIRLQEVMCFSWIVANFVIARVVFDLWPVKALTLAYLVALGIMFLNHTRTLAAHRYTFETHTFKNQFIAQFADSVNVRGGLATEIWAPLGQRYHALHHLFPGIPYYNLGAAHRRLLAELPAGSLYHRAEERSLFSTLKSFYRATRLAHEVA